MGDGESVNQVFSCALILYLVEKRERVNKNLIKKGKYMMNKILIFHPDDLDDFCNLYDKVGFYIK